MQVEVNEENIIKYGLVQFTGNTMEMMLLAARRAEVEGYTLLCEIPDDNKIDINVFDHGMAVTPADPFLGNEDHGPFLDVETVGLDNGFLPGRVINVEFADGIHEVIEGEVVSEED